MYPFGIESLVCDVCRYINLDTTDLERSMSNQCSQITLSALTYWLTEDRSYSGPCNFLGIGLFSGKVIWRVKHNRGSREGSHRTQIFKRCIYMQHTKHLGSWNNG